MSVKFNPFQFIIGVAVGVVGALTTNVGLIFAGAGIALGAFQPLVDAERIFQANNVGTQVGVPVVYGSRITGGVVADYFVHPTKRNRLYGVVCVSHSGQGGLEIEDIEEIYADGELAVDVGEPNLQANGTLIPKGSASIEPFFRSHFSYGKYLGGANQGVPVTLNQVDSTRWPTTSRGRGIAHITFIAYIADDAEDNVWAGPPTITARVKGVKVYDPRSGGSWGWSDNPALHILDYLTATVYGRGIPLSEIDAQSFIDAANHCDGTVSVPDDMGGSTTQKRYRSNGIIDTNATVQANLQRLQTACNGKVVWQSGVWRLVIRQTVTPASFNVDRDMIAPGTIKWLMPGLKRGNGANSVIVNFVNEEADDALDTLQWPEDETTNPYLEEDNYFPAPMTVDLPFTTNKYTALQIGSIMLKEQREGDQFEIPMREEAMELEIGDVVPISQGVISDLAPLNAWVMGLGHAMNGIVVGSFMRYNSAAYTLPTLAENLPPPAGDLPERGVGAVTGLTVSATARGCVNGFPEVEFTVGWTSPATGIAAGYQIQYREDTAPGPWIDITPPIVSAAGSVSGLWIIGNLTDTDIRFRVRPRDATTGVFGPWTEALIDLTASLTRTAPNGGAITAPDITVSIGAGAAFIDVDTTGTNATIFRLHASGTTSFTPSASNLMQTIIAKDGDNIRFAFVPPVAPGATFYYRILVGDCFTNFLAEAYSQSGEFNAVFSAAVGPGGQKLAFVDLGNVSGTVDIDWEDGWMYRLRMTGNVTLTFSGYAAGMALELAVEDDSNARTLTFPAVGEWSPNGVDPSGVFGTSEIRRYTFGAEGTTLAAVYGQPIGINYS